MTLHVHVIYWMISRKKKCPGVCLGRGLVFFFFTLSMNIYKEYTYCSTVHMPYFPFCLLCTLFNGNPIHIKSIGQIKKGKKPTFLIVGLPLGNLVNQ